MIAFSTYYINLPSDIERNASVIEELEKTNLKYNRYEGTYGKNAKKCLSEYNDRSTKMGQIICTPKTFGVGISHISLNKYILENDDCQYALILEDDIIATEPGTDYNSRISEIITLYNNVRPDWDIIRLHSFFVGLGSCAAYVVNRKSMDKISKLKLEYHIDIQMNKEFNIVHTNELFTTKDILIHYNFKPFNYYLDNQKVGFYFHNHALNILGNDVKFLHILLFYLLVIYLSVIYSSYTLLFVITVILLLLLFIILK